MPRLGTHRTKIVATLGPASQSPDVLERMARAGLNVARINLAHGTPDYQARLIQAVRATARRAGRSIAVMVDLAGPKIRVGEIGGGKVMLEAGRRIVLSHDRAPGTRDRIPITEARLARDLRRGDPIYLADGTLELRTLQVSGQEIACEVVTGGLLLSSKGINVPRTPLRVPGLTPKDREDLRRALRLGVDAVALSFVREASDVERARRFMGRRPVPIIAKIEKREAVENLDAILDAADGAMVARGDLAVETSLEELPLLQKQIIRAANERAKPVITATQMLLSMVENPRPTRAEAADVANAILDGTDAVMLSEETARGRYPVKSVEMMGRIAASAETALDPRRFAGRSRKLGGIATAVSEAAVEVAAAVGAQAIVTPTFGGATPRFVSRLRPRVPVVALTENPDAVPLLCFSWGVHPYVQKRLGPFDETLRHAGEVLQGLNLVKPGQRYVVTAGFPQGMASNLMTVQLLGKPKKGPPRPSGP